MTITVNGIAKELKDSETSVIDLLVLEEVNSPDMVSVQVNGDILQRDSFETTGLADGDSVEFLYFMGGGSANGLK